MLNYYNYFTEIEERFQQRRGSLLLLSTLDWALIETWREAGIPLEAVLHGIDAAFDKHEIRQIKSRQRRINGLAWCTQAVMEAAQEMSEAAIGSARPEGAETAPAESGFEAARIAAHLAAAAAAVASSELDPVHAVPLVERLRALSADKAALSDVESLERTLTVLEEKLFAALTTQASESLQVALKEQAASELAPYRSRMGVVQIRQVERQFLHKKLLEHYRLPRFSLFYMNQS